MTDSRAPTERELGRLSGVLVGMGEKLDDVCKGQAVVARDMRDLKEAQADMAERIADVKRTADQALASVNEMKSQQSLETTKRTVRDDLLKEQRDLDEKRRKEDADRWARTKEKIKWGLNAGGFLYIWLNDKIPMPLAGKLSETLSWAEKWLGN